MEISLQTILQKQKAELQQRLEASYVRRDAFGKGEKMMGNDLIKVIIGPRRSGKSIFAMQLLKDQSFAYLNFDEEALTPFMESTKNYDVFLDAMEDVYGRTKTLFFDEIQNLARWELFANRLHRTGYNLIITGSNANLLSRELSTHLTGRHFPIEILPFNFPEYLRAKNIPRDVNKETVLRAMRTYITEGGYPEVVVKNIDVKNYLGTLFDSIIFKDIVRRYRVRQSDKLVNLALYLINNVSHELSSRKLAKALDFKSVTTIEKFLRYLEESYLFFILRRYSHKTLERLTAPKKVYLIDNGYIAAKAVQLSPNEGALMENLIFCELIKYGFKPNLDLFYYKTHRNKEVDFVVRRGHITVALIQVSYEMIRPETEKREFKALLEAANELHCDNLLVITRDKEEDRKVDGMTIRCVPFHLIQHMKWF